jgi:hypothetical protein
MKTSQLLSSSSRAVPHALVNRLLHPRRVRIGRTRVKRDHRDRRNTLEFWTMVGNEQSRLPRAWRNNFTVQIFPYKFCNLSKNSSNFLASPVEQFIKF